MINEILKEFESKFHPKDNRGVFGTLEKGSITLSNTSLEIYSCPAGSYQDIKQFLIKVITQTREETIREVDLTGKSGDTIYHHDLLIGKRYTWKCVKIDNL